MDDTTLRDVWPNSWRATVKTGKSVRVMDISPLQIKYLKKSKKFPIINVGNSVWHVQRRLQKATPHYLKSTLLLCPLVSVEHPLTHQFWLGGVAHCTLRFRVTYALFQKIILAIYVMAPTIMSYESPLFNCLTSLLLLQHKSPPVKAIKIPFSVCIPFISTCQLRTFCCSSLIFATISQSYAFRVVWGWI